MSGPNKSVIARQLRERRIRTSSILGGALPTTAQRLAGYPPARSSEAADRATFLKAIGGDARPEILGAVEVAGRATAQPDDLWYAINILDRPSEREVCDRLTLYLALEFGDRDAQDSLARTVRENVNELSQAVDVVYGLAFAALLDTRPTDLDSAKFVPRLEQFIGTIANDAQDIMAVKSALDDTPLVVEQEEKVSPLSALSRLAHRLDESEKSKRVKTLYRDHGDLEPADRSLVVVPNIGEPAGSTAQKDLAKQFKPIAGTALPIAGDVDLPAVRSRLIARYPHFITELDLILRQRRPFRLLLVGSPGCGKTSLARDLAAALALPSVVYTAGGTADASFAGTSAQWSTARASTPLQTVLRHRRADPLVILDELEKAGDGRHNGSFVDAALSFLEPSSARRVLDPAIEVEVDLSAVSYVATANALDGVPSPLLDRLRVIRMPDPKPEHATALMPTILDDIANERGLDRRWIEPLAADEMELVVSAWPGGSLRRLRRVLELLLDGREKLLGRA